MRMLVLAFASLAYTGQGHRLQSAGTPRQRGDSELQNLLPRSPGSSEKTKEDDGPHSSGPLADFAQSLLNGQGAAPNTAAWQNPALGRVARHPARQPQCYPDCHIRGSPYMLDNEQVTEPKTEQKTGADQIVANVETDVQSGDGPGKQKKSLAETIAEIDAKKKETEEQRAEAERKALEEKAEADRKASEANLASMTEEDKAIKAQAEELSKDAQIAAIEEQIRKLKENESEGKVVEDEQADAVQELIKQIKDKEKEEEQQFRQGIKARVASMRPQIKRETMNDSFFFAVPVLALILCGLFLYRPDPDLNQVDLVTYGGTKRAGDESIGRQTPAEIRKRFEDAGGNVYGAEDSARSAAEILKEQQELIKQSESVP